MRNSLAIVTAIALSSPAYAQSPQVINPRALFPRAPWCPQVNSCMRNMPGTW